MADLTALEVVQVLNSISPDNTIYCLSEGAADNPVPALIYVAVKVFVTGITSGERPAYYRIADTLTIEAAIERISAVLKGEG